MTPVFERDGKWFHHEYDHKESIAYDTEKEARKAHDKYWNDYMRELSF